VGERERKTAAFRGLFRVRGKSADLIGGGNKTATPRVYHSAIAERAA